MLPFYLCAPEIVAERAFYAFFPLWKAWLARQKFPRCNIVQAIIGYGTEPFRRAESMGALKVHRLLKQSSYYALPFLAARTR